MYVPEGRNCKMETGPAPGPAPGPARGPAPPPRAAYTVPAARHRVEQSIERSRFITTLAPAATAEEARAVVDGVRQEFADATHNCWAFVAGPPGDTRSMGMSDAGEPHGTAGRPMLDVLLHSGIGEVVAVVTRYYGGTKLGKGGLVRAYGGAVQHGLASLPTALRTPMSQVTVAVGYADVDGLRRLLEAHGGTVAEEDYGAEVTWTVMLPAATMAGFRASLADRTAGRARVREAGNEGETR
jgi:uncharacterized YigZ family protein